LRSFDRTMPEEINRILTDCLSDLFFITEQSGWDNLLHEGVDRRKMHLVGNVMIDSLIEHLAISQGSLIQAELGVAPRRYSLVTLHRPANVDQPEILKQILDALAILQTEAPVVFPVHPRTRKMMARFGFDQIVQGLPNLRLTEPLGYLAFIKLMSEAQWVITDSGGVQEETTFLDIPCLTLRENTERPVTLELGSNRLVKLSTESILHHCRAAQQGKLARKQVPPLWDGHASERILNIVRQTSPRG
jgi:UDP-N-acetylglucosamine 2-epimerase (non-hydrolysing)